MKLKTQLEDLQNRVLKLSNVYMNPEYQKIEMNYILGQQKIAQALTLIESIQIRKELKDKLVNTLAWTKT